MDEVNFDEVVKKFNYPQYLSLLLNKIFDSLVEYYGKENKDQIFASFYNTEVIVSDGNIYDDLIKEGFEVDKYSIIQPEILKKSLGNYYSEPVLIHTSNGYDIKRVNRVVIILKNENKKEFLITLIHELSHMVKSFPHEFEINGNRLLRRSGLIKREEELTYDGSIHIHLATEKGIGLEEGLNTLEEEEIMNMFFDKKYKSKSNALIKETAKKFRDGLELKEIFRNIQFGKDQSIIKIDSDLYEKMIRLFDKAYDESLTKPISKDEIIKYNNNLKDILIKKLSVVYKKLKESLCQNYQK